MEETREKAKLTPMQKFKMRNLPIPGPGRPKGLKDNPEKKARKQFIEEYKDALAEALPLVSPALVKKAVQGDVSAIRELNDVIVDKASKGGDTNILIAGKPVLILGGLTQKDVSINDSSKKDC